MKKYFNCFIAVLHFGFYFYWQRLLWIVPAVRDIFESRHPVVLFYSGVAVISAVLSSFLAVILFSNYSTAVGIGVGAACYLWIGIILDRSLKDINYNYIYSDASWILGEEDREILNQIASVLLWPWKSHDAEYLSEYEFPTIACVALILFSVIGVLLIPVIIVIFFAKGLFATSFLICFYFLLMLLQKSFIMSELREFE